MAKTYESIATQTLGTAVPSITFTGIPQGYTDLVVVFSGNSTQTGSSVNSLRLRVNGNPTVIYSDTGLEGNGTSASSYRSTGNDFMVVGNISQASGPVGNVITQLMNYSNTTTFKTVLSRSNNSQTVTSAIVGLFRSTSAITSIEFYRDGTNNIAVDSTFSLYGIKAAI